MPEMPDDRIKPGLIESPEDERAWRAPQAPRQRAPRRQELQDPCIRAENEDDDGYDPYSDRRPDPEPLFEPDPWA